MAAAPFLVTRQKIPRSAEMEYMIGTPLQRREPVTHPVSTFYEEIPDMIVQYESKGIFIGADSSIIMEQDVVMNRNTLEIKKIDYFHGSHPMRFTVEGEMVEKSLRIPVAQMCPDEDNWLAHDMILIRSTRKIRRGARYRYVGPFYKAVLTLQRIWRTKPPSGRLLTKW